MSFIRPNFKTNYFKEVTTLLIDLKQDKESLFNGIKPNFRNEIRRAESISCRHLINETPNEKDIKELIKNYSRFAGKSGLEEDLSPERLNVYAKNHLLIVTEVLYEGKGIATHVYILHGQNSTALLLSYYNVDFNDNAIRGYANKFLHWKDMEHFKEKGFAFYDFGGIDTVDTPEGIAKFKQSFGGKLVNGYNFSAVSGLYGFLKSLRTSIIKTR